MKGQVLVPILMLIFLESTYPCLVAIRNAKTVEPFPSFEANRNVKSLFLAQGNFHLVLAKGSHKLTLK